MPQLLATRTSHAGVPAPGRWVLDSARTRVSISGRASRFLPTVRAGFAAASGEVCISDDPTDARLEVSVGVASLSTGKAAWDQALRAADPLSAASFPVATFRSRTIRWIEPGHAHIDGELELTGRRQPVSLSASYHDDGEVTLTAAGSIVSEKSVSVPGFSYLVPREFTLDIEAVAVPA